MTEIKMTFEQAERVVFNVPECEYCPLKCLTEKNELCPYDCDDVYLHAARLLIADARKDAVEMAQKVSATDKCEDAANAMCIIAKYPDVKP